MTKIDFNILSRKLIPAALMSFIFGVIQETILFMGIYESQLVFSRTVEAMDMFSEYREITGVKNNHDCGIILAKN